MKYAVLVAALAAIFMSPAEARHHHHRQQVQTCVPTFFQPCGQSWFQQGIVAPITAAGEAIGRAATYLAHPAECPSRAFCGCGAAHDLGLHDRSLWSARSWYRFPRSAPAPNTVAVRSHHVFVLKQHVQGSVWLVADYNSGHHQSRLHTRSISGYTIVSPHV